VSIFQLVDLQSFHTPRPSLVTWIHAEIVAPGLTARNPGGTVTPSKVKVAFTTLRLADAFKGKASIRATASGRTAHSL
jgi:hypothetical protein